MSKLWFSIFNQTSNYQELPYFENSSNFEFTKILESNYSIIKEELLNYIKQYELPSYFNTTMVDNKNTWKTISLKSWNINLYQNYKHFPKCLSIMSTIPNVVSFSFSMLAPKSKIVSHNGDTNGIFRCHLGLSVPAKMPECGFRVGDEWQSWEEGKLLIFIDANNHEAFNNSNENRFIIIIDIIRPQYVDKKRWICATVRTSLFLQKFAEKYPILYKLPLVIQKFIAVCLTPIAFLAIPVRNFLYIIKK